MSDNPFVFDKVIDVSYLKIPLNCAEGISSTESLIPKPVSISPVQPAIPTTVIIALFLYLKIFRAVTLCEKLNLFQMKDIFSNKIFLPFLGGFGLISTDGICFSSFLATSSVAPPIQINASIIPIKPIPNRYVQ